MENKIYSNIQEVINNNSIIKMTISSPINKKNEDFKITIENKTHIKDNQTIIFYQISTFFEKKVRHENFFSLEEFSEKLINIINVGYQQYDINCVNSSFKILSNKNGKVKVINDKSKNNVNNVDNISTYTHDSQKNYILKENTQIKWLISLGVMNNDGLVLAKYKKKFRQLNKFLEMVEVFADKIPQGGEIIDVGCGKSYLTFALYYYLNILKGKNVKITGLDLKSDIVKYCQGLSDEFGFENLKFINENIETYKHNTQEIDMIISLHACDVATDFALFGGIKWKAKIILSVPCCQNEMYTQIKNKDLDIILKHGILKERFSSIITDAIRAEVLEICGYKTDVMEFIETEHTPKNIMIRAIKRKSELKNINEVKENLNKIIETFNAKPKLVDLVKTINGL